MTEDRDPVLHALFVEAQRDLEGEEFIAQVMLRAQKLKYRIITGIVGAAVLFLVFAWIFSLPIFDLAFIVTEGLGTELLAIGNASAAWILAPINNIATALVVLYKVMRMGVNKARTASYVN